MAKTPEGAGTLTGRAADIFQVEGVMLFEAEKITLPDLALIMMAYVDQPVVDMTGLNGYYQVALNVPGPPNAGGMGACGAAGMGADAGGSPVEASDPSGSQLGLTRRPHNPMYESRSTYDPPSRLRAIQPGRRM